MEFEVNRSKMDISRSSMTVAVEKCQLCCYTRRPMTCSSCIQQGIFYHSADEFIAENNYVNKKKIWNLKKKETIELKDELNELIRKKRIRKEKLLRIQKSKVNMLVMKEALTRLNHQFKQESESYEDVWNANNATRRELLTIKTKIKNILDHLKKQPPKQEFLSKKLHTTRAELAGLRKKLSNELTDKIFPVSHSNEYGLVSSPKELTHERLKQISIYLSQNASQITSISEENLKASSIAMSSSKFAKLKLSQIKSTKNLNYYLDISPLTTSSSNPSILPSSSQQSATSELFDQIEVLNKSKISQSPFGTPINNATTTYLSTATTDNTPNITLPPTFTINNSITHLRTNLSIISSSTNHPSKSSSYEPLNSIAINLLKDARMTAFIDGKWVYSTDHEDSNLQIIHACLPANLGLLLKDKKLQSTSDIQAGLSLLTQLITLLALILDFSLPKRLHFKEFSGELTGKQLQRCLVGINFNIKALCHYENLTYTHHSFHPLRNILRLLQNPLLGCDEATSSRYKEVNREEGLWILEESVGSEETFKRKDGEEDADDDDDEGENEDDSIRTNMPFRFPHRLRKHSSPLSVGSIGEGNWEYISPHIDLIPEDSQQFSTSSMLSSDTIGSSMGAYVTSLINQWRS